jgi:hypothetical protein
VKGPKEVIPLWLDGVTHLESTPRHLVKLISSNISCTWDVVVNEQFVVRLKLAMQLLQPTNDVIHLIADARFRSLMQLDTYKKYPITFRCYDSPSGG